MTVKTTRLSRRQFGTGISAAALAMAYGVPGHAQSPLVLKFSHVVTANTPKGKGAIRFKELAEKYTEGKVKVEIYPSSTLYKDQEEMEALSLGAVQILAPATGKFAPSGVKEFEALDFPYVIPSQEVYTKIVNGPVGKSLLGKLEARGIKGLAFWDNGFYIMSANRPLHVPTDCRGLKMRISGSKVDDAYLRAVGAIPQIMAFSELYQALQTGVVDGTQNTASNYLTQKLPEVQKHITLTNHGHLQYAMIANLKFWDGFPADIRAGLDKAVTEASAYANSISVQENVDALAEIRKSGKTEIYTLKPEELKQWQDAMLPIHKSMESRVGKEILDVLHKEAGFTG